LSQRHQRCFSDGIMARGWRSGKGRRSGTRLSGKSDVRPWGSCSIQNRNRQAITQIRRNSAYRAAKRAGFLPSWKRAWAQHVGWVLNPRVKDRFARVTAWVKDPPYEWPCAIFHPLGMNRRSITHFAGMAESASAFIRVHLRFHGLCVLGARRWGRVGCIFSQAFVRPCGTRVYETYNNGILWIFMLTALNG